MAPSGHCISKVCRGGPPPPKLPPTQGGYSPLLGQVHKESQVKEKLHLANRV